MEFDPEKDTTRKFVLDNNLVDDPNSLDFDAAVDRAVVECSRNKDNILKLFTRHRDSHFQMTAKICGMKFRDGEKMVDIVHSKDMAKSIVDDTSPLNVKRLCWILYYSTSGLYKRLFGVEFSEYLEMAILKEAGIQYKVQPEIKGKGCVALYLNKLINGYRTNVKECFLNKRVCGLGSILNNTPKGWLQIVGNKKPKPKNKNCLFWVGTKTGDLRAREKATRETPILTYEPVSTKFLCLLLATIGF